MYSKCKLIIFGTFDRILILVFLFLRLNGDGLEHYFTNANLKSEIRNIFYRYQNYEFTFLSDNGVFSKDKVDYGSRLLIETVLKFEKRQKIFILDIGCGYGFLGTVAGKVLKSEVILSDVNKRALHLSSRNLSLNRVSGSTLLSNVYENIESEFDLILTNPPIRAGKEVILNILLEARNHLKQTGFLWFVIRKDQGAKSICKEVLKYGSCEIVEKSKGFYVYRVKFG